jgi:hypothetical protein
MPYFKPFPVADESALKRFGARAQTVVRRCTRTVARLQDLSGESRLDSDNEFHDSLLQRRDTKCPGAVTFSRS